MNSSDSSDVADPRPVDRPDLTRLADPPARPSVLEVVGTLTRDLGVTPRGAAASAALIVALTAVAWWWWHDPPSSGAEASIPLAPAVTEVGRTATTAPSGDVVAHAAGAVARPGVYTLTTGSRVADLIDAAGGAVGDADLDRINLAAPLGDGAQVHVPLIGEPTAEAPIGGDGGPGSPAALIDLNTAGAEELETLPGVGPATSAAILQHRRDQGRFASVDDLIAVPGIGDAKLAALRDLVTV